MSHLRDMATLLGSLTALFSSSASSASEMADEPAPAAIQAARALIDEDLADDAADETMPPWSTSASLAPAAMDVAASFDDELAPVAPSRLRLPLPLQAYVAGGALALFAGWLGNHPPHATIDHARGEVVASTDGSASAAQTETVVEPSSAPSVDTNAIDISSLPTVTIGKLPVSAILTISVEELPNARRLAVASRRQGAFLSLLACPSLLGAPRKWTAPSFRVCGLSSGKK
jgi:hypothetical protein